MNYIIRLKIEIDQIERLFSELLDTVNIEYRDLNSNPNSGVFILTLTNYYWCEGPDPIKTKALQRKLKDKFTEFKKCILYLCENDTELVQKKIEKTFKYLDAYIELKSNPLTPENTEKGKDNISTWLLELSNILDHIEASNHSTIPTLVPDTNALIINPDPNNYKEVIGHDSFYFVITTPVLRELDNQKDDGKKSIEYREKVKKVIKRIKGYRNQGDITTGVTINKTIIFKMDYKEPKILNAIDWLDPLNIDDQIIMRALELQKESPSSDVIIVTADINLQNKASGANLRYSEPS